MKLGDGGFVYSAMNEGIKSEKEIIIRINDGINFYTFNYTDKIFTSVIVVNNQIKSNPNETKEDNIGKLPLLNK